MLPKGLLKEHWRALSVLNRALDMAAIFLSGFGVYYYKFSQTQLTSEYYLAIFLGTLLLPLIFSMLGLYNSVRSKGYLTHLIRLTQAVAILAFILAGAASFSKMSIIYSRAWFGSWMLSTWLILVLYRFIVVIALRYMRTMGMNERRVVIFGAGVLGIRLAESVHQALWTGFRVESFLDDEAFKKPATINGIPVMMPPTDLGNYLKLNQIDEIWLALPLRAEKRVKEVLHDLRRYVVNIRFVLDIFGMDLLNHSASDIVGFPVLNINTTPMVGMNRLVKALEDRLIAAMILLLISPLLILISIAIKMTSKGPILFKQERLGWDGRVINVYKFRTMYEHAEPLNQVTQATINDTRITPFGRLLRRTSLDELPQFINVLQGRMSIVGPRPHALAHNEKYKEMIGAYMQRHKVKPGITGWAQINGWRGETDTLDKMEKRVEYDLFYINNWSLGFDLRIILLTILRGFVNPKAY